MIDVRTQLAQYVSSSVLPDHDELMAVVDGALSALEGQGAVRDFLQAEPLPLVVVPDLHARRTLMRSLLDWQLPGAAGADGGKRVLELLEQSRIRVVCVGDLFHSEVRGIERWLAAYVEFCQGEVTGPAMSEEMCENLRLLELTALLQSSFPDAFVFLKGNHENIANQTGGGDYSFVKYANEGAQVAAFMQEAYGDAVLHVIRLWERALPLCALFPECAVSHAEPVRAFSREEIEARTPQAVQGLIWTRNDEAERGSVQAMLSALLGEERAGSAVWISGHRPVRERYALRQGGALVQIHNPYREQVALVLPGRRFDPETGIYSVCEER